MDVQRLRMFPTYVIYEIWSLVWGGARESRPVVLSVSEFYQKYKNNKNCHLISTPTNAHTYIFYIKTFKIATTCFDPKIIIRQPHYSLLKSHY